MARFERSAAAGDDDLAAARAHLGHTLRELAGVVDGRGDRDGDGGELRARRGPSSPSSPSSASSSPGRCPGCGRASAECDGCLPALDPPRFCTACGTRLRVQVTPAGYTTLCRSCGG